MKSDIASELDRLRIERDALASLVADLDESSSYWSEYEVPLGIVERIKEAAKMVGGRAPFDAKVALGMADCMEMLRSEMLAVGVIDRSIPPMFFPESIIPRLLKLKELERQKPIAWLQDVNRHNGQPSHYEHVADSHGGQDGTFQAFRLPVPANPADYTLPAGSMGAKKLEQLGGWEHWKPMGLVLHNNVESVAITEHGRVTWGDAPARPNSRLLAAARAVVARWETPTWKDAPATAGFIYELRDAAIAAAEFNSNSDQAIEDPALSTGRTYSTKEAAAVLNLRPNTLNVALCTHGTYFGVTPKKKKNGRLVWNAEQIDAMAAGEVSPREVAE